MRLRMRGRSAVGSVAAVFLGVAVAGCSPALFALSETEKPPTRYALSSPTVAPAVAEAGCVLEPRRRTGAYTVVIVERPTPRASLADSYIVVRSADGELRGLAGARWASPLPAMIQDLLRTNLESGCLHASKQPLGLEGEYVLSTELVQFEVVESDAGSSSVRVEIAAHLLARRPRRLAGTQRFFGQEEIDRAEVAAIVAAFDAASVRVAEALRDWVIASIARAHGSEAESEKRE